MRIWRRSTMYQAYQSSPKQMNSSRKRKYLFVKKRMAKLGKANNCEEEKNDVMCVNLHIDIVRLDLSGFFFSFFSSVALYSTIYYIKNNEDV